MRLYPMKMRPAFKDYLWGGTRLRDEYGKRSDKTPVAESWEVSCHPDGPSVVDNGPYAGRALASLLEEYPAMMGRGCAGGEFPILIKLIDAREILSVQVHPGDGYARRVEGQQGKNELWYVLDAAPGASLLLGFDGRPGKEEIRRRIADDTLTEITRGIPVKAGDCFMIPAGMLHAIGGGILIAEIQQNSNVTYRLYDFGRRGADGRPRELHVGKGLDVLDLSLEAGNMAETAVPEKLDGATVIRLTDWDFFHTDLVELNGEAAFFTSCDGESCHCLLVTEGRLDIAYEQGERLTLGRGESAFLPAGLGAYALEGKGKALLTTL